MKDNNYSIYSLGDQAITISFGDEINIDLNQKVHSLHRYLVELPNRFWLDLIPAYSTLTVVYDVVAIRKSQPSASEWVRQEIEKLLIQCDFSVYSSARNISIPVCYDSAFASDWKILALKRKLNVQEIIRLHTKKKYRVFMIGFLPGFAYMGKIDDRLATPRLETPRKHVPAGSVGIAGNQTGVYPFDSPGGWNIIGRTPLKLFDANRKQPALLQPGDAVKFFSISSKEFVNFDFKKFDPFA